MSALGNAALAYATDGLAVLPLEPGGKEPHSWLAGPPICGSLGIDVVGVTVKWLSPAGAVGGA